MPDALRQSQQYLCMQQLMASWKYSDWRSGFCLLRDRFKARYDKSATSLLQQIEDWGFPRPEDCGRTRELISPRRLLCVDVFEYINGLCLSSSLCLSTLCLTRCLEVKVYLVIVLILSSWSSISYVSFHNQLNYNFSSVLIYSKCLSIVLLASYILFHQCERSPDIRVPTSPTG